MCKMSNRCKYTVAILRRILSLAVQIKQKGQLKQYAIDTRG